MSWLIQKAKTMLENVEVQRERAKAMIPVKYHSFIIEIDETKRLCDFSAVSDEEKSLGVWANENGTFISYKVPYMTVSGRVLQAREEHREQGKKLNIHPPMINLETNSLSVLIESELLGSAAGTSMINRDSDITHAAPLESSETSAIGRALGFLGYGVFGNGIASAEEIEKARAIKNPPEVQKEVAVTQEPPPKTTPKKEQKAETGASKAFRIKVLAIKKLNKDGSAILTCMFSDKTEKDAFIPKELKERAKAIKVEDVLSLYGWNNANALVVDGAKDIKIEAPKKK